MQMDQPIELPEPPQPGIALVEGLDKKTLVVLRDGRKIIGYLRSFDQFANLVLDNCINRIIVGEQYGDVDMGVQIIRGENVVLLGEIDESVPDLPANMQRVTEEEIKRALKAEKESKDVMQNIKKGLDAFMDLE